MTSLLCFDSSVEIRPEPRNFRHAQDIVDRLQNHTAPDVFRPKALYDGQSILFASHVLNLPGGGSGNVGFSLLLPDTNMFTHSIFSLVYSCPINLLHLVDPTAVYTTSSLHAPRLRSSTSREFATLF
jgi:hypothetical protein